MFLRHLVACATVLWACTAHAGPDRISLLIAAEHFGGDGFETFTPGLFATWDYGRTELSVGAFRNSYGEGSVAGTLGYTLREWGSGNIQAFGGVAYYDNADEITDFRVGDVVPLLGVQLRQGAIFTQLLPLDGDPVDAILTFGLTTELK